MEYNVKLCNYAGSTHYEIFSSTIYRTDKNEEISITDVIQKKIENDLLESELVDNNNVPDEERSSYVSANRAKKQLIHLARSNAEDWEYFVTFTFNPKKIDSFDYDAVSKACTDWMSNLRKKNPDLKYILVPELHKSGRYHYHALIAYADSLILSVTGKVDHEGAEIYNLDDWDFGFTTASKIKDKNRVTNYICKYITKDLMCKIKNKKRYYASRNCYWNKVQYDNMYADEVMELMGKADYIKTVHIPESGQKIAYLEVNKK